MKKTVSLITSLFLMSGSFAQTALVLDETTVPSTPDSVTYAQASVASVQPATKGAAQAWDFSSLQETPSPSTVTLRAANSPNFPNADLTLLVFESIVGGSSIKYYLMYEIDSASNRIVGYDIHEQRYGLQGIVPFAQPTDSFIVPEQHVIYSPPQVVHDFPATEGSSWKSNIVRTYNGYLTFAALSFNNVLVTKVVHESRTDTVAGWGKLRIPHASGGPSIDYDVLMIQRARTIVDSFYLNNIPADSATLALFQLQQGQSSSNYRTFFYRGYQHQPMMYYFSSDATFSNVISLVYDKDTDPLNTGLEKINHSLLSINIFPNPVLDNAIHISITAERKEQLKIRIFDLSGKMLSEKNYFAPVGVSSYSVNAPTEKGTYLVATSNEENEVLYRQVVVQ